MVAGLALAGVLLAMLQPPLARRPPGDCPRLPFALCFHLWDR